MARHHRVAAELESHSCHHEQAFGDCVATDERIVAAEQTGRKLMNLAQHGAGGAVLGCSLRPLYTIFTCSLRLAC